MLIQCYAIYCRTVSNIVQNVIALRFTFTRTKRTSPNHEISPRPGGGVHTFSHVVYLTCHSLHTKHDTKWAQVPRDEKDRIMMDISKVLFFPHISEQINASVKDVQITK